VARRLFPFKHIAAWTRVARWFVFKPKSKFGLILEGLAMEEDGIFY
jgi:hypothetical protein